MQRRVLECLRLDGPDHQGGAGQVRARAFAELYTELLFELGALSLQGFYDLDACRGHALLEQAAYDGAGHVAAAYKGDVVAGVGC